jgi:hypothetical protein
MASDGTDWDEDLPADPEEDYQTLSAHLTYRRLSFVIRPMYACGK